MKLLKVVLGCMRMAPAKREDDWGCRLCRKTVGSIVLRRHPLGLEGDPKASSGFGIRAEQVVSGLYGLGKTCGPLKQGSVASGRSRGRGGG